MCDEFNLPELTQTEEKYRIKIQSEIIACYNCQPYDSGEPVWIFGEQTEIEDLFYKFNVDEKHWGNIARHLACPECGTQITLGSDLAVKSKYERQLDKFIKDAKTSFVKKIDSFLLYLNLSPLLGYKHPIGKKIWIELEKKRFPTTKLSSNDNFYRARKVNSHDILESSEMLNAPIGKSTEGRYNHSGQSHLYLAERKDTAMMEVVHNVRNCLVWIQEFKLSTDIDNILDLTFDITNISLNDNPLLLSLSMSHSLEETKNNKEFWRPDYFATRYIMDCAKELKYNGIKYNSTRNFYDFNVVLFYPENFKIENVGNPIVEIFKDRESDIFDD